MRKYLMGVAIALFVAIGGGTASADEHIITVAKEGGDYNGIKKALASIWDSSEKNRYVIAVGPGKFSITEQITMKPYVSIVGSGRESTVLVSRIREVGRYRSMFYGGGYGVDSTNISNLAVDMYVNEAYQNDVILACDRTCPKLNSVDFTIRSRREDAHLVGVFLEGSNYGYFDDVDIRVSSRGTGVGIRTGTGGVFLSNSNVRGNIGISGQEVSDIYITDSTISGGTSLSMRESQGRVQHSTLSGKVVLNGGTSFDGSSTPSFKIQHSLMSSLQNNSVDPDTIFIDHSIIRNGSTISGPNITCTFTSNGEGGVYGDDCTLIE